MRLGCEGTEGRYSDIILLMGLWLFYVRSLFPLCGGIPNQAQCLDDLDIPNFPLPPTPAAPHSPSKLHPMQALMLPGALHAPALLAHSLLVLFTVS